MSGSKIVLLFVCLVAAVFAGTTSISILEYRAGLRVEPFHEIPKPKFFYVDGATVSIEFGYVPLHDKLFFDYQGDFPIEGEFNDELGVLYLSGRATTSEYVNAISSVVFVTSSEDGRPRRITYSLGDNTFFFSLTEHYYRYYRKSGIPWEDARTVCNGTTFFDMQGYLATITSSDEQSQIGTKSNFTAWLGGSDHVDETTWRWVTGPEGLEDDEKGRVFWSGPSMYGGGSVPPNGYSAWNRFQPDNGNGVGENYLYLVNSADPDTSYWADATNVSPIEGFICEYGGLDSPAVTATLHEYTGSVQLFLECGLYDSKNECTNRASFGCSWSSGSCHQTSCSRYHTQEECDGDYKCNWNVEGFMGVCANTECAGFDPTSCPTDTCTVRDLKGIKQCWPGTCADQQKSCDCADMAGCVWREGKCGWHQGIDCSGMDVIYLIDGTITMAQQFGRHNQGFRGLTDLFLDSQQVLTGTKAGEEATNMTFGQRVGFIQWGNSERVSKAGVGSGGRLTGDIDEYIADLQYQQTNFRPSTTTERSVNRAMQLAFSMFAGKANAQELPDTGRQRVLVIFSAGGILDAIPIARKYSNDHDGENILAQMKKFGVSLVGVALRPTDPDTMDSLEAKDSLSNLLDGAQGTVLSYTLRKVTDNVIYGLCGNAPLATAVEPLSKSLLCTDMTTPDTCQMNAMCAWDASANACRNSGCLATCDAQTCVANPTCDMQDDNCVELCAGLNETNCGETIGVGFCAYNFDIGTCEAVECVSNPTEDGCIADANNCQYNPLSPTKCEPKPCDTQNSAECSSPTAYPGCVWNGVACYLDVCKTQENKEDCSQLVQCQWSPTQNKCTTLEVCGLYLDEMACANDHRCAWNVTQAPGACGPAKCTYLNVDPITAEVNCKADDSCVWQLESENNLKDMCVVKTCEIMKRSCDCATLDGCVWRNNTCMDNTFVQCPAMDVVFLVEGTPTMLKAFGRHPNGYYGIIESIREWSEEAPFSLDLESPGFRMALVNYGLPRLALSVPPTIGSGGNLTGDINKWVGTDMDLDWNERNIFNYATSGQNNAVAIKPALIKAINIFNKSSEDANRKRLVVILGTNAITDGANLLNKEVAKLEAMGVQIFANVIRRFSYITPVDLHNADFIRPLASDPPTQHFAFTTIDNMKKNLLEKLCDPSTGTGQALGISRDGELPCSWLLSENECNIQGSCRWNSSAPRVCPNTGECPNLECRALPDALANKYHCSQCEINELGTIECSLANPPKPHMGRCMKSTCLVDCDCNGASTCTYNAPAAQCETKQCGYSDRDTCNDDTACIWKERGANNTAGECVLSQCGRYRAIDSCNAVEDSMDYLQCEMDESVTPAICLQQRCPVLFETSCRALASLDHPVCKYTVEDGKCTNLQCTYDSSEQCEMDSACYWDNFATRCHVRVASCVLSNYSEWAPCTASCGSASTFKQRTVVQFPSSNGESCKKIAERAKQNCQNPDGTKVGGCEPGVDDTVTTIRSCAVNSGWVPPFPDRVEPGTTNWPESCPEYCSIRTSKGRLYCMADNSCMWKGSRCQVKPFMGCVTLNQTACAASDMCAFDVHLQYCKPVVSVCRYDTQSDCTGETSCQWKDGTNANVLAKSLGWDVQLVNPGQVPIFPFTGHLIESDDIIHGASVVIETNYQRGKDLLDIAYGKIIKTEWVEQSGLLKLKGAATVSEYSRAIRFVTFETTSTRKVARKITWSFGNNTVYSSATGHLYRAETNMGASYAFAKAACAQKRLYGLQGYLATITSLSENDVVSSKALGVGWISGDDDNNNMEWQLSTGPEAKSPFWKGPSTSLGGTAVEGGFANWLPPNATNIDGEPVINVGPAGTTGENRVYMARSGFWESRLASSQQVDGYICEFGGLEGDVLPEYPIGGAMLIGVGGCVPQMCIWHADQTSCERDIECSWSNNVCQPGCASFGTESECESSPSGCRWDTAVLPPTCDVNHCAKLSLSACNLDLKCKWGDNDICEYREGCPRFEDSIECNGELTCIWVGGSSGTCQARPCETYGNFKDCRQNMLCSWNSFNNKCTKSQCIAGTETQCKADPQCMWNQGTKITVGFTPNGAEMHPFADGLEVPVDTNNLIDGVTIAIVEGFQKGHDILSVDPEDNLGQQYIIFYNAVTGVLKIRTAAGVQLNPFVAWNFLRHSVKFSSDSTSTARRKFAVVYAGNAMYSPESKKFLKYISRTARTYAAAEAMCKVVKIFGISGRVATIRNEADNLYLTRLDAKGWIAAKSDANSTWDWMTADGDVNFWNGQGVLGTPVAEKTLGEYKVNYYARWGSGQPADASGYGYFQQDGTWITIQENAKPLPRGIICEYDAPAENVTSSAYGTRLAEAVGCFVAPCLSLAQTQCQADLSCAWRYDLNMGKGGCQVDTACMPGNNPTTCARIQQCEWDYSSGMCRSSTPTMCSYRRTESNCNDQKECVWNPQLIPRSSAEGLGACVFKGCRKFTDATSCSSDSTCQWLPQSYACSTRLCGYLTPEGCWRDSLCMWTRDESSGDGCTVTECARIESDSAACADTDGCVFNTTRNRCEYKRCSTTKGKEACQEDTSCLFLNDQCSEPQCNYVTQAQCSADDKCYFSIEDKKCLVQQCISNPDKESCEKGEQIETKKTCVWDKDTQICRAAKYQELNAAKPGENKCDKEKNPNLWWLWLFLAIIIMLLGVIFYRLYLAYAKGHNFFEPTRKNYKYNPHQMYASELFEDAQKVGEESNFSKA